MSDVDDNAVEQLYAASFQRLVVQLYAVTGDLGVAQDVVQEAFVRLLVIPQSRRAELANPETWLRRVAINLAYSLRRRRQGLNRVLSRLGPPPVAPDLSPDHVALMAAMLQLPADQRVVVALYYLADLPVTEVADTLGISPGTVKSRLARARPKLKALLASDDVLDRGGR